MSKEKLIAYITKSTEAELFGSVLTVDGPVFDWLYSEYRSELWDYGPLFGEMTCHETGMMVWEGECRNTPEVFSMERDPMFVGQWRRPTAIELYELRQPAKNR